MNILHLHTGLNLTCGISKTIYLIARNPSENINHFVIALNGDAERKFIESGIPLKILNIDKDSFGANSKSFSFIKKFVKENNINILHSHHRYMDFLSFMISFSCDVRRVTSVQSFVYGKKYFSYKSPLLLAAGESVKKHLINYFGIDEKRIKVFNNFIDTDEIPDSNNTYFLKSELKISPDAYIIGYVGRFSIKEKGIDVLINAFKMFSEKYPDSFLVMVGSGEEIKEIKEIPPNVIILNSKKNIFDYYRIFDCVVLPSRVDPFPLTALEAGMMKKPFIGSDVNGISEIIENEQDGLLFPKESSMMLLEKLEKFYNDSKFAVKCGEKYYQKVTGKYNIHIALQNLNKIYEGLK